MRASRRLALVVGQLQLGGAERQLFELATRLDPGRYDPVVICLSEVVEPFGGRLRSAGVPVVALPRAGHYDLARVRALASAMGENHAVLAHSFLLAANAYTWGASLMRGRLRFIASSRTCIPPTGRLASRIHRRAFLAARAIIANSERVRSHTCRHYRLPAGRIRVIRNGVDLEAYRVGLDDASRAAERERMGIPAGALLIGSVGRLSPEKNLPLLLAAAGRLKDGAGPPVHVVLVGDGPSRESLVDAAAGAGLSGRVTFAGPVQDVARAMRALDVFVLTSDTEGLPNAVMEAMASGVPVVATRAGGTDELVLDGVTGFLVDRGDAATLAERLAGLAADAGMRRRLGRAGRARIEAEFGVERMVGATMDLYDEVMA